MKSCGNHETLILGPKICLHTAVRADVRLQAVNGLFAAQDSMCASLTEDVDENERKRCWNLRYFGNVLNKEDQSVSLVVAEIEHQACCHLSHRTHGRPQQQSRRHSYGLHTCRAWCSSTWLLSHIYKDLTLRDSRVHVNTSSRLGKVKTLHQPSDTKPDQSCTSPPPPAPLVRQTQSRWLLIS